MIHFIMIYIVNLVYLLVCMKTCMYCVTVVDNPCYVSEDEPKLKVWHAITAALLSLTWGWVSLLVCVTFGVITVFVAIVYAIAEISRKSDSFLNTPLSDLANRARKTTNSFGPH